MNPNFSSKEKQQEEIPQPFTFDFNRIKPNESYGSKNCQILRHDSFYLYQSSLNKIAKVFLVLNQYAIFIYKDREHYECSLENPKGIIIFSQLNRLVLRQMDAQGLFRDLPTA